MVQRRSLLFSWLVFGCALAALSGCITRKGFIISSDIKLEFNRVPWRCGPDGRYEVDGPDCLDCFWKHKPAVAMPGEPPCEGGVCLEPTEPIHRYQFHAVPTEDVFGRVSPLKVIEDVEVGDGTEPSKKDVLPAPRPEGDPPKEELFVPQSKGSSTRSFDRGKTAPRKESPAEGSTVRIQRSEKSGSRIRRTSWIFPQGIHLR